jgi:ABC-type arginine/histidine transport system permease subunit
LSWGYIWLLRSIPLIVLLLILNNLGYLYETITIGIPFTNIVFAEYPTVQLLDTLRRGDPGLSLNQAAFSAEIIRGGILSVDHGQHEAAAALGLPRNASGAPYRAAAGHALHRADRLQRDHRPGQVPRWSTCWRCRSCSTPSRSSTGATSKSSRC